MDRPTEYSRIAQDLDRHGRARSLREAYSAIVTSPAVLEGRIEDAFRLICSTVATLLELEHCSIWLIEDESDELKCWEHYDRGSDEHSGGQVIPLSRIQLYLSSLRRDTVLDTDDAPNDPRCVELLEDYLLPRGIGAMLDSSISLDGEMRGVVCCETVGVRRRWFEEEIFFMRALADQVALTLGNRVRREAVELIRRNDSFFRDLFENSPLGITIRDNKGRLLVHNRSWQKIWALDDEFVSGLLNVADSGFTQVWASYADYSEADIARIETVMREGGLLVLPEVRVSNPRPGAALWVAQHLYVTRSTEGSISRVIGITEDITGRKRAEQALSNTAASLHAATGAEFFRTLTSRLCQELEVSHALIGQLIRGDTDRLETIAICHEQQQIENIRKDIEGTPSVEVLTRGFLHIRDHAQRDYPQDMLLRRLGVRSYMGIPLRDSKGEALGLIAVLGKERIPNENVAASLLEIFSNRASAELERLQAQQSLSESEERFRIAVSTMTDGMVMLDSDGNLSYVNDAMASLIGMPAEALLGLPATSIVAPEDRDDYRQERERRQMGRIGDYETNLLRHDGSTIPVRVSASPMLAGDGRFLGSIAVVSDLRAKRREEQAAREHREEMRRITAELSLAEERERRRIASSLHDGIGHSLTTLRMLLDSLAGQAAGQQSESIARGQRIATEALESARSLVFELSPPMLHEFGLLPALRWLAENTQKNHGIPVTIITQADEQPLDEEIRVLLYQAVRELLFNAVKHSRASNVVLTYDPHDSGIRIGVADDGVGFDFRELTRKREDSRSFGLFSINERLNHIGGRLEINSRPGSGASFFLTAPSRLDDDLRLRLPREVHGRTELSEPARPGARELRLLIVDDHQLIRQGLRSIISVDPGIEIVAEAENGRQAVELCREVKPDIILMDIDMPELDGIRATEQILISQPDTRIIGLSMHEDIQVVGEMLSAGASGYLLKDFAEEDLLTAIHSVSGNMAFISSRITERIVQDYITGNARRKQVSLDVLTERELDILRRVMRGDASKNIALDLEISIRTVETHRRNIMKKLGVDSLPALIRLAISEGLEF